METQDNEEKRAADNEQLNGIIKLAGLLIVLMVIWYGFNLADGV